jgi:hypothetical protein
MKGKTYLAIAAGLLFMLSCFKPEREVKEDLTSNLKDSTGEEEVSARNLNERKAALLAEYYGKNKKFIIKEFEQLPVPQGYAANVTVEEEDGKPRRLSIISENNYKTLSPSLNGSVHSESKKIGKGYVLVCQGSCECKAFLHLSPATGQLLWTCGCEDCTGHITAF